MTAGPVWARAVARENRFALVAALPDGRRVRAHLPSTARLTELLAPGALVVLEENDQPGRRTRWTVTRVWDGVWVAQAASRANVLVAAAARVGPDRVRRLAWRSSG